MISDLLIDFLLDFLALIVAMTVLALGLDLHKLFFDSVGLVDLFSKFSLDFTRVSIDIQTPFGPFLILFDFLIGIAFPQKVDLELFALSVQKIMNDQLSVRRVVPFLE